MRAGAVQKNHEIRVERSQDLLPNLPQHVTIRRILGKHWHLLTSDGKLNKFITPSPNITFRRVRSLGDSLMQIYTILYHYILYITIGGLRDVIPAKGGVPIPVWVALFVSICIQAPLLYYLMVPLFTPSILQTAELWGLCILWRVPVVLSI